MKRIIYTATLSVIIISLAVYVFSIDKYQRDYKHDLLMISLALLCFVALVWLGFNIGYILKNRNFREKKSYIPAALSLVGIVFPFTQSFKDEPELPAKFKACHEGTFDVQIASFRNNGQFDISMSGDKPLHGNWRQNGDTIFLDFISKKAPWLEDTNVIKKNHIVPLSIYRDSTAYYQNTFFIGRCKDGS